MKIGFIGNANNYPFSIAQSVRRLGHEIVFIVDKKNNLDRPEGRYPESYDAYDDWIVDFSDNLNDITLRDFMKTWAELPELEALHQLLKTCDFFVVNGLWPILIRQLNKGYFVQLTGADIEQYADPAALYKTMQLPFETYRGDLEPYYMDFSEQFCSLQRQAYAAALGINSFPVGMVPNIDRIIDTIHLQGRRFGRQFTDCNQLKKEDARERDVLRVFNIARLNWVYPIPPGYSELDYKGTNVLLYAAKQFIESYPGRMELVLVRKGLHQQETLELVQELGLGETVFWLDEMSQDTFLEQVRDSDVIIDTLSAVGTMGMGSLDSLSLGKPVITSCNLLKYTNSPHEEFPICQCETSEEIVDALEKLLTIENRANIGNRARSFAERNYSSDLLAKEIIQLFMDHIR